MMTITREKSTAGTAVAATLGSAIILSALFAPEVRALDMPCTPLCDRFESLESDMPTISNHVTLSYKKDKDDSVTEIWLKETYGLNHDQFYQYQKFLVTSPVLPDDVARAEWMRKNQVILDNPAEGIPAVIELYPNGGIHKVFYENGAIKKDEWDASGVKSAQAPKPMPSPE